MTEQEMIKNDEEIEINLGELFAVLKSQYKLIVISILVMTIIAGIVTTFFISRKYQSTASIYPKPEVSEGIVDYTQINANNLMVNNYIEMLKGNNIQSQVAETLGLTTREISRCVSISNQTNTQIISISATTTDPQLSKDIVDELVSTFKKEAKDTLNINNISTIDQAQLATTPVSPNLKMNLIIFIKFMLDTHIHNREEAEKYLGIPCLGSIPYFDN